MEEETTLSIMNKMVNENNQGILLSTTIIDVRFIEQGAVIGFGVSNEIGLDANTQTILGGADYLYMCFAVKKSELAKYRKLKNK